MTTCRKCGEKFPLFTIRNVRHPSPFGDGDLCRGAISLMVLSWGNTQPTLKKTATTDPKAAAWVALCCLLAAQRVNLVRTITAAIVGLTETQSSWEVCRQRAVELATKAMTMFSPDSDGRIFVKALLAMAAKITEPPPRKIRIQQYASVMGDTILAIEHQDLVRSGVSIDDLNNCVAALPGHQWLLNP